MDFVNILIFTLAGTLIGTVMSFLPSLHIYNVAGFALIMWGTLQAIIPEIAIAPFFISLVVAFSFINSIPMTYLGATDESAHVTILPGTKNLLLGKGYETIMLSGLGCLMGMLLLALLTPLFFYIMPYIHVIVRPHLHWILLTIMTYMLMSEWPKGAGFGKTVWQKFSGAWGNLFAGIVTFALSGILGIIITSKSIVPIKIGFQNIMPVFMGLFAIPSIIQNIISTVKIPDQKVSDTLDINAKTLAQSAYQGVVGGLLCAYFPLVTVGIGGIIGGAATALRGDKVFIISGGVAKFMYYVGSFLFLFVITPLSPFGFARGGLNILLKPIFSAQAGDYLLILSVILFSGFLSFILLDSLAKFGARMLKKINYRAIYWGALIVIIPFIYILTDAPGLLILAVASCIGTIPVFYHCRRSNCMAVLLVPITLNVAGYGEIVAELIGLF